MNYYHSETMDYALYSWCIHEKGVWCTSALLHMGRPTILYWYCCSVNPKCTQLTAYAMQHNRYVSFREISDWSVGDISDHKNEHKKQSCYTCSARDTHRRLIYSQKLLSNSTLSSGSLITLQLISKDFELCFIGWTSLFLDSLFGQ